MALQVWLPLTGNLENKGLCNITATNSGATVNSAGKIGSCYSYTTTQSSYLEITGLPFAELTNCSISFWIKVDSMSTTGWLMFTGQSTSYYVMATQKGTGTFYHGNAGSNLKIYKDGVLNSTPGATGEWHHYVVTGVNLSTWTKFYLDRYSTSWNFAGEVNDIRIYDHILSKREIHDLAQGLILHYKLDDPYLEPTVNLLGSKSNYFASGWSSYGFSNHGVKSIADETPAISGQVCRVTRNGTGTNQMTEMATYFTGPILEKNEMVVGSVYVKGEGETIGKTGRLHMYNTNGTNTQSDTLKYFTFTADWQRVKGTFTWRYDTASSASYNIYVVGNINNGESFLFSNVQVEEKDHATPFTAGSRNDVKVYDCSGYENNGVVTGSVQIGSDTPRYSASTNFLTAGDYISRDTVTSECKTASIWCYVGSSKPSSNSVLFADYNSKLSLGFYSSGTQFITSCSGTSFPCVDTTDIKLNSWNHIVLIHDGSTSKVYINGVLQTNRSNTNNWTHSTQTLMVANRSAGNGFVGQLSDFRLYATVLSDEDIKELYNTAATIDKGGNFHSFEFYEDNIENGLIEKTGEVKTNDFIEKLEYLYLPANHFVNTQLYYNDGDQCKAVTVLRYDVSGSGRDLMGYSGYGSGYWGVTAAGAWERRGTTMTYTDPDITVLNTVTYIFSSAVEHGYYQVGALGGTWSPRSKYIYSVKLWKNGTLERDMVPVKIGNDYGLYDIVTYTFYPCNNNTNVIISSDPVNTTIFKRHIDTNQLLEK